MISEPLILIGLLLLISPWLSQYITWVFRSPKIFGERSFFGLIGAKPGIEMSAKDYIRALVSFHVLGFLGIYLILIAQGMLPLNPQLLPSVPPLLAANIAISFLTNTNWQSYAGETTLTPLAQTLGLCVQNFLSAAVGLSVMVALARSFKRKLSPTIGNLWSDLYRSLVFILMPFSLLLSITLMQQGVPQTFSKNIEIKSLEGASQQIVLGPVASQTAIKQLGSNGGGYYNVNSAHPLENPSPLTNFLLLFAVLILPFALILSFGELIQDRRHGWALFGTCFALFLMSLGSAWYFQSQKNPALFNLGFFEGQETRFSHWMSELWSVATTATSNGSTSLALDSLSPASGGISIVLMMTGSLVFGGVGCGVYGLVLFAILTVFLAGLMVGRTPEYLGKKITQSEVILASVGALAPGLCLLITSAIACVWPSVSSSLHHLGPHALSDILYAFSSAASNNGSAFASLDSSSPFFLISMSLVMLVGRFAVMIPVVLLAGNFAAGKITPPSMGTFPTNGFVFSLLLAGILVMVALLTFFPVLALGPLLEHLLMMREGVF